MALIEAGRQARIAKTDASLETTFGDESVRE
jgi:hypothetical protein